MNTNLRIKHALLGVVAGVLITLSLAAATGAVRTTWEYRVVTSVSGNSDELTQMLDRLGDDHWELVSFTFTPRTANNVNDYSRFVFKRQR